MVRVKSGAPKLCGKSRLRKKPTSTCVESHPSKVADRRLSGDHGYDKNGSDSGDGEVSSGSARQRDESVSNASASNFVKAVPKSIGAYSWSSTASKVRSSEEAAFKSSKTQSDPAVRPKSDWKWKLLYSLGVISTLAFYDAVRARMTTHQYDGEEHVFQEFAFLNFFTQTLSAGYAGCLAVNNEYYCEPRAPLWTYFIISIANVYVIHHDYSQEQMSINARLLGDTIAVIFVLLSGTVILNKWPRSWEWSLGTIIALGALVFLSTGPEHLRSQVQRNAHDLFLLGLFLALHGVVKGFVPTFQERLFKKHRTSKFEMMFYVNAFSACISGTTVLGRGRLSYCLRFGLGHRDFVAHLLVLGGAAFANAYFVYSLVQEYGAITLPIVLVIFQVTTSLPFFYDGHQLLAGVDQCFGLVSVLVASWISYFYMSPPVVETQCDRQLKGSEWSRTESAVSALPWDNLDGRNPSRRALLEQCWPSKSKRKRRPVSVLASMAPGILVCIVLISAITAGSWMAILFNRRK